MKNHPNLDRELRKQKASKVPVLEDKIHLSIARYLDLVIKRPSRWHTVEVSNQAKGRAAMFRQVGGFVESIAPIASAMIFLEVKIPGGSLTEKQAALHKELKEDGHDVFVVHDVKEVETILKKLGVV